MTSGSPVERSSRLDQRHQKLWCRKSSVCIVVRRGCWLWQTEAHHDDLLTQREDTVQPGRMEPCRAAKVKAKDLLIKDKAKVKKSINQSNQIYIAILYCKRIKGVRWQGLGGVSSVKQFRL